MDCVPHAGHVHEWLEEGRVVRVQPRHGLAHVCRTCGDVAVARWRCHSSGRRAERVAVLGLAAAEGRARLVYLWGVSDQ